MDIKEKFEDKKGGIRCRSPRNDIQEGFEDTKGVIRGVHRRTNKKSLQIQKE
jgi:hypothetical protein